MADESLQLDQVAEEFTADVRAGKMPHIEEYAQRYPELAGRIRELFPTLILLEGMAARVDAGAAEVYPSGLDAGSIFGQYRIEREIGRGGMGIVYEAHHLLLQKEVALKVLPVRTLADSSHFERFFREARTAAGLHHTNIVPVFDVGQVAETPYFAMQYIEGRSLDQVLRQMQSLETSRPARAHSDPSIRIGAGLPAQIDDYFRWVAGIGIQAAEGLAYAHERKVVHRDIKPSNLLLDRQGLIWITDFGLARNVEDPALTLSGVLIGTPRYMSPEQADPAKRPVDQRSDIYSLGATLYELLTCRPVFEGQTPQEVLSKILVRSPVAPRRLNPEIPADLETVVMKALAKRPEDRYQTANDLAEDLIHWLKTEPIRARPIGPIGRTIRWCRRNPRLTAALAASLVIILSISGLYNWLLFQENAKTQTQLARSLYERARTVRLLGEPGRRWQALDLLRQAATLSNRFRGPASRTSDARSPLTASLPSPGELRNEAITALLMQDGRVHKELSQALLEGDLRADSPLAISSWIVGHTRRGLRIFDYQDGQELAQLEYNLDRVDESALSRDGRLLAILRSDGIDVRELPSGRLRTVLIPPDQPLAVAQGDTSPWTSPSYSQVVFSPDARYLAASVRRGSRGSGIALWDLHAGSKPRILAHGSGSSAVTFSPDGKQVTFTSDDGAVTVMSLPSAEKKLRIALSREFVVDRLVFDMRGRLLAVPYRDPAASSVTILIWDCVRHSEYMRLAADSYPAGLAFEPDDNYLAASDGDDVVFFDLRAEAERSDQNIRFGREALRLAKAANGIRQLFWEPEGRRLITSSLDGIKSWELQLDSPIATVALSGDVSLLGYSSTGQWLMMADSALLFVNSSSGKEEKRIPLTNRALSLLLPLRDQRAAISSALIGKLLEFAAGGEAGRMGFADIQAAALTHEGHLAVIADGSVRDVEANREICRLPTSRAWFAPTGRFIAGFVSDVELGVWEFPDFRKIAQISGVDAAHSVQRCLVTPDGQAVVSWSDSQSMDPKSGAAIFKPVCSIWSVGTGRKRFDIMLRSLSMPPTIGPDSRLLALGYLDGTAQLWDIEAGQEIFSWKQPGPAQMHFSPDGNVISSYDVQRKMIQILDLRRLHRDLAALGIDW